MPRTTDEHRRTELIEASLPYLAEHGIATLSLRPLAAALGTSDRMLIHYFGSKEQLIGRVLQETRPDVPALIETGAGDVASVAGRLWAELSTTGPQHVRVRLLLQVMTLALTQPTPYGAYARAAVDDWIGLTADALRRASGHPTDVARERATVLVSGLRGLAMDRYITGDAARTDRAAAFLIRTATADD